MAEAQTVVVPSSEVKGDITNCKIEKQLIKEDIRSIFSLKEVDTYVSYDVCSKQIISQWEVPTFTFFGVLTILFSFLLVWAIGSIFSSHSDF